MPAGETKTCRFLSSLGGTQRCRDAAYQEGLCRCHFETFLRGEVLANGQLDERLADQHRRREINYHGIPPEMASPGVDPPHR